MIIERIFIRSLIRRTFFVFRADAAWIWIIPADCTYVLTRFMNYEVIYISISISYLFKSPAMPPIENLAFLIRFLSGSIE